MFSLSYITLISLLIINLSKQDEQLVLEEMTTKTFTNNDIDWSLEILEQCQSTSIFTEFVSSSVFGIFSKTQSTSKTIKNLPPHWSISVRFDVVLYMTLNQDDYVTISVNSKSQKFTKTAPAAGQKICKTSNSYGDEILLFSKNVTHSLDTLTIKFTSNTNAGPSSEGFLLRNFYAFVDTCHQSCASCSGPASNQCQSCPENSVLKENTCTCNDGFVESNFICILECPQGYIANSTGKQCVIDFCDLQICQSCSNGFCISCKNGNYLLNGQCVKQCPNYTYLSNEECKDKNEQLKYGKYEYKGLYDNTFGESQIYGSGITVSGFFGYQNTKPSGALVTKCDSKSIVGGAYLSSTGSIRKVIDDLKSHWQVIVGYTLYKIDNWQGQYVGLYSSDSLIDKIQRQSNDGPSNLCGLTSYNDEIIQFEKAFPHEESSLILEIKSNLDKSPLVQSFGIREFFIFVDYCTQNCNKCDSTGCLVCEKNYHLSNHLCVLACPLGSALDSNNVCQPCDSSCATCSTPGDNKSCLKCKENSYLNADNSCKSTCPTSYQYQNSDWTCQPCHESCYECQQPNNQNSCTKCNGSLYLQENQCIEICEPGFFQLQQTNNNICQECHQDCQTCEGPNNDNCLSCISPNYFWQPSSKKCVEQCNSNQYQDTDLQQCSLCNSKCETCFGPNENNCFSCPDKQILDENQNICVESCPDKFYEESQKCQACHDSCLTCNGGSQNNCLSCSQDFYFESHSKKCVKECNSNSFIDYSLKECISCDDSCLTCSGIQQNNCLSCKQGMFLQEGHCVSKCDESFFAVSNKNICQKCDSSCQMCNGPNKTDCLTCQPGSILLNSQCQNNCPSNYYKTQFPKTNCQQCNYKCSNGCDGPTEEDCFSIKYQYSIIFYILLGKITLWIISSGFGFVIDKKHSKVSVEQLSPNFNDTKQKQPLPIKQQQISSIQNNEQISNIHSKNQLKQDKESPLKSQNNLQQDIQSLKSLKFKILDNQNKNILNLKPNEIATTQWTVSNIPEIKQNYSTQQQTENNKYKTNQIGNEWVSLFYFYDNLSTRVIRATLIFLKYQAFFISSELIHQQSYGYLILSLIMGWTVKVIFNLLQNILIKKTQKMIAGVFFICIIILVINVTFWFAPQFQNLDLEKDENWSLYYCVLFLADFLIFQQIFSLFQYVFTIRYLIKIHNNKQISRLHQILINSYFIKLLK